MGKKKRYLKITAFLLALSFVFSGALPIQTQALSKKQKAMKAYRKFLKKETLKYYDWVRDELPITDDDGKKYNVVVHTPKVKFATAYINNDKIPELIISVDKKATDDIGSLGPWGQVYTYKSGKVRYIDGIGLRNASKERYYKKKNLIADYDYPEMGGHAINYFRMKGTSLICVLSKNYWSKNNITYDEDSCQGISKKEFNKILKKMKGEAPSRKFKWHKNNSRNRKKYLK